MQYPRILLHLPLLHMEHFSVHIQPRLLQVWQIKQGLTVQRRTKIGLPVTNLFTLIKSVHKIAFQSCINIKIIRFFKSPPGTDIPVG